MTEPVIDQARGIMMACHDVSAADALLMLNERSRREHCAVGSIASEMMNGYESFPA